MHHFDAEAGVLSPFREKRKKNTSRGKQYQPIDSNELTNL
jgi:hypothetical protein